MAALHRPQATGSGATVGRVCLGGDATHIHSPIGARGQTGRLDDYDRLRRPIDAAVVRNVRALTSAVRSTSASADQLCRFLIPPVARTPVLLHRILRAGMGLDHPVRLR